MSDQDAKSSGGEPSMEDILASIRRILAEDTAAASPDADPEAPPPDAPRAVASEPEDDWDAEPASTLPPQPEVAPAIGEVEARDEPVARDGPKSDRHEPPRSASLDGAFAAAMPERNEREDVFVLTPEMRIEVAAGSIGGERVVSNRTADSGTDVLAQLASAILDRRDIAVGARDITLESMVREMLRPLLREWLDRNLPYLIERLVKREIDMMVNRAERLED